MNRLHHVVYAQNNADYQFYFNQFKELTLPERIELLTLLQTSYPHYSIDTIVESSSDLDNLTILRVFDQGKLIASRQAKRFETIKCYYPTWAFEMIDDMNVEHFAIGTRAIVHPSYRGYGLGTLLVEKLNSYLFNQSVQIILGSSTSPFAIRLYNRLGAKLYRNHKALKLEYFKILRNNYSKNVRLPKPMTYYYLP